MHLHDYEWIEEPGDQSRVLEWVRDCKVCHFSPERPSWRVIVTGSRDHTDETLIYEALDAELDHATGLDLPMVVVEGECPYGGADAIAVDWAIDQHVVVDPFPANWAALGKRAGNQRNQVMVNAGGNVCLAFPLEGSRGTWDCVRRAEEAGIPVKEF